MDPSQVEKTSFTAFHQENRFGVCVCVCVCVCAWLERLPRQVHIHQTRGRGVQVPPNNKVPHNWCFVHYDDDIVNSASSLSTNCLFRCRLPSSTSIPPLTAPLHLSSRFSPPAHLLPPPFAPLPLIQSAVTSGKLRERWCSWRFRGLIWF